MAKRKDEIDDFDDSFVDGKHLAKVPNSFVDGETDDDGAESDEDSNDPLVDVVVLNVDITGNDGCRILRFDTVEYTEKTSKYGSRYYCLDFGLGTNGMFDMLDEYFSRRFRFLHSSKSCQVFMTAMADVECIVRDMTGKDFFKLCGDMNGSVVECLESVGKCGDDDVLWDGYGISGESVKAFLAKRGFFDEIDFDKINEELVKRFNFYREYVETKHFCAFCVQFNDDLVTPNVVEDPVVSLPLVVYIPKFAEAICEKVAMNYLTSDVFQDVGIEGMNTNLYLLMPDAKVSDLKSLYKKNLKVKDFDGIEECDFVTGLYKTLSFDLETSMEREDELDSIIGYA